jgi:hypothetical protein
MNKFEIFDLMDFGGCELTLIQFIRSDFPLIVKEFKKMRGGLYVMHSYPYANSFAKYNVPGFKEYLLILPPEELKKYTPEEYPDIVRFIQEVNTVT